MSEQMADPLGPDNESTSAIIWRQILIDRYCDNPAAKEYFEGSDEAELVWLSKRLVRDEKR
jgi:hypothetical protein